MTDPLPQPRGELTMIERLYFTPRHAAPILGVTPQTAARWCRSIPGFGRRVGGRWRIDAAALDRLLSGEAPPPPADAQVSLIAAAAADPTTTLALIRREQAAEAELAATRAAIAEWRKDHWTATADTRLMETMDRIAEGILE